LVAADLPDQAGAVRDLVASYRRARASETRTEQSRPRAWLPLMLGVVLLVAQAASRRTAALVGLAVACLTVPRVSAAQQPQLPRSPAEKAWDRHDLRRARVAYLAELAARRKEDAAWYNAGTAALADSDAETAQASLAHAAASLDPDLRFRALYNLGLLALRQADDDSAGRDSHLADAERAYREALLLRPHDRAAKWNLELAIKHRGGSQNKAPPSGGGSGPPGGGARGRGGGQGGVRPGPAGALARPHRPANAQTPPGLTGFTIVASREVTEVTLEGVGGPVRTMTREVRLKTQRPGTLVIGSVRVRQGLREIATPPLSVTVDSAAAGLATAVSPI